MEEYEIIEALVGHFGEEFREEIAETLENWGRNESQYSFDVGGEEWNAIESYDKARAIAIEHVKDMLYDEPQSFNQEWLQSYIIMTDTDRRILAGEEANNFAYEVVRNQPEDYIDELQIPEEYLDDPKEWSEFEEALERLEQEKYDEIYRELEDPVQYFVEDQGMYEIDGLMKASFISIDYDTAAEDAIDSDGWEHFLSTYDGNSEELENGVIIYRA